MSLALARVFEALIFSCLVSAHGRPNLMFIAKIVLASCQN